MRNIELEQSAERAGYKILRTADIDGSLVDYCLEKSGHRILVLIRSDVNETDLTYLSSIGQQWDRRAVLTGTQPSEHIMEVGRRLRITVGTNTGSIDNALGIELEGETPSPSLVNEIAKLSWGARIIVLVTGAWREVLGVFILGFVAALALKDVLWPWVRSVVTKTLNP